MLSIADNLYLVFMETSVVSRIEALLMVADVNSHAISGIRRASMRAPALLP